MRSLLRNQQKVFFKLYEEQTELVNEHGEHTGQHKAVYGPLQWAMLCVSPNKGSSEVEQFGSLEDYDRTMTVSDTSCPIDEDAVLWIDGADTQGPHNAIVKLRAPWKNSISYAIKMVEVSLDEEDQNDP